MHSFRLTTLGLLSAALFNPQHVLASDEIQLPGVAVTADAIDTAAQAANLARHDSPNFKTVIEAEQLNQFGDQPLGDALRRLVGVSFDGANRAREIQLRNVGVEYTQVTINGRRVIDGNSSRTVQVDRIPSSLVERIEIAHTPLASQDAQGAAGTVNIVLKQAADNLPNEVGLGLGYLEKNGMVGDSTVFYTTGNDAIRLTLSGGIQQQRRNESKDIHTFTGTGAKNGGSLNTNERRYEQVNFTPRVDLNFDDQNSLVIEPLYLRTTEFRDDIKQTLAANQNAVTSTEDEFRKRTRENTGVAAAWKYKATPTTDFLTSVDWQTGREDTARDAKTLNSSGVITGTRQRTEDVSMDILKFATGGKTKFTNHTLEYGVGHATEKRDEDNSDVKNGVVQPAALNRRFGVEEEIFSLYVQDSFSPFAGNLLTVGIRNERSETQTRDFYGATKTRDKMFTLPSLSMRQSLTEATDFRVGLAKTVRRPDLRELSPTVVQNSGTYAKPDVGGNPDATPESILGLDVGIDQFFYSRKGLVSAKTFVRDFTDKLETIYTNESGRIVTRPQNAGDGHMKGIELEARIPLIALGLERITVWSNFTAVETEVESKQTGEKRRFLNQPDQVANFGIDWFVPSLKTTFGGSLNYSSGYYQRYKLANGTAQANDVESMKRFDLSARTQLTKQTSLNFSALNLFAPKERRVDSTYTASGALSAVSKTTEQTYRTVYLRLSHLF